ncbi:MAG: ParB/RepB/Spo0J family partition protein [Oscillospiraceae bacterium]|nr:ParB/RepB/Spo0J family partition protein [Oscillospiraceae bacterium]
MAGKEKRGLGTGLDALFGPEPEEAESELQTLPIAKIEPRADQPRERFDEASLQELAESIGRYGLIQPITVRKLDGGYYQIIAGERRWRASRLAGLLEVPARVIEADDRRAAELALVENLQREDLNPIEEAQGYQSLMRDYGLTQEETAQSVGRSRPAVANALRLLSLSEGVRALVESGKLSAGHARALLPLEDEQLQLRAAKTVLEKELSVRKTEQLAAKLRRGEKEAPARDPLAVDYAAEVGEALSRIVGRRVRLIDGRRSGRIEIEYYGAEDREALIELLSSLKR